MAKEPFLKFLGELHEKNYARNNYLDIFFTSYVALVMFGGTALFAFMASNEDKQVREAGEAGVGATMLGDPLSVFWVVSAYRDNQYAKLLSKDSLDLLQNLYQNKKKPAQLTNQQLNQLKEIYPSLIYFMGNESELIEHFNETMRYHDLQDTFPEIKVKSLIERITSCCSFPRAEGKQRLLTA